LINIILVNVIILIGDNGLFRNLVLVMLFLIYFWENYLLEISMLELGLCYFSLAKLIKLLLEVFTLLIKMNGKIKPFVTMVYIKLWNIIQHLLLMVNFLNKLYGNWINLAIWDTILENILILLSCQSSILNLK
jgi:hypothetical protein